MGLIKAAVGSFSGNMADQWKEFFYCDALDNNTLVMRGKKQTGSRSSNTRGNDNVISNGSGIAVADGQCMIIVEQGEIVEFCAEPGQFTWNSSTEPSLFCGSLGETIKQTFQNIGRRFTFGGDAAKDQRVYYFNTKQIMDNKFGTANPFMFRVVNSRLNLDRTVNIRCNGVYSYKITNPLLFYAELCGNVQESFTRDEIDGQLKTDFVSALQPAFSILSDLELRPHQIPAHQDELEKAVNEVLKTKWTEKKGITVTSISLNPITLTEEDMKKIQQMEDSAYYGSDARKFSARMGDAAASAMEKAAENPNGAMAGFMGMGMAGNMLGGMNIQGIYQQGVQEQQAQQVQQNVNQNTWKCSCGAVASGNFCMQCGAKKPEVGGWTCSCGAVNTGNFCPNCGSKKPGGIRCDKCGWKPEGNGPAPKFCPNCGDPIDSNDMI